MQFRLLSVFTALLILGCTATQSDVVLVKTEARAASCTAAPHAGCASCSTACPALKQALCIGGEGKEAAPGAPAACEKAASCSCVTP